MQTHLLIYKFLNPPVSEEFAAVSVTENSSKNIPRGRHPTKPSLHSPSHTDNWPYISTPLVTVVSHLTSMATSLRVGPAAFVGRSCQRHARSSIRRTRTKNNQTGGGQRRKAGTHTHPTDLPPSVAVAVARARPSRRPVAAPLGREQSELAIAYPSHPRRRLVAILLGLFFSCRQLGLTGGRPPRSRFWFW